MLKTGDRVEIGQTKIIGTIVEHDFRVSPIGSDKPIGKQLAIEHDGQYHLLSSFTQESIRKIEA